MTISPHRGGGCIPIITAAAALAIPCGCVRPGAVQVSPDIRLAWKIDETHALSRARLDDDRAAASQAAADTRELVSDVAISTQRQLNDARAELGSQIKIVLMLTAAPIIAALGRVLTAWLWRRVGR